MGTIGRRLCDGASFMECCVDRMRLGRKVMNKSIEQKSVNMETKERKRNEEKKREKRKGRKEKEEKKRKISRNCFPFLGSLSPFPPF